MVMKKLVALLGGGILAAGLSVGALAHEPGEHGGHKESTEGKPITVQGELIDTACFVTSDGDAKVKDHAESAQKCMASGVPACILADGSKDSDGGTYLRTHPQTPARSPAKTTEQ